MVAENRNWNRLDEGFPFSQGSGKPTYVNIFRIVKFNGQR